VPEAPRKRRPPIVLIALGVLVVLLLVPWLLRSTIATSMARSKLEEQGLRCDDRFSVDVSATFSEATIGPTRCEHDGGLVEAVELGEGGAQIVLSGFSPQSITIGQAGLALRDQDVRGGEGWGTDEVRAIEQRVAGLVKGLAEISVIPWPETNIAHLTVSRGGNASALLRGMRLTRDDRLHANISGVEFPRSRVTLENVTGTATRAEVTLDGQAHAQSEMLILAIATTVHFTLHATGLDGAHPTFRLRTGS
jgi:hypothetical protein